MVDGWLVMNRWLWCNDVVVSLLDWCSMVCWLMNGSFTIGRLRFSFCILGALRGWSSGLWRVMVSWHVMVHWNLGMLCLGVEDGRLIVCLPVVLDDRKIPSVV